MTKVFACISAIFVFIFVIFSKTSDLEDHSLFYINGRNIYETIKNDGSFGNSAAFFIIEKINKIKPMINTGEYSISTGDSVFTVIKKMLTGEKVTRKITIPEGYTVQMIIQVLNKNELLFGEVDEIPQEASLMPDTYFYQFGDSKASIISKMKNRMKKTISDLKKANNSTLAIDEAIILASIIEKETGIEEERSLVSSVFHNRLNKKMRLQSDPTVIYGLTNGYGKLDRKLTKKDLWFESKHNTYRNKGLPPTPICCPGEKAIYAAINPKKTDFLYFVANKEETLHKFSNDYEKHRINIKSNKTIKKQASVH